MARKYKTKEEVLLRDVKTNEIKRYDEWVASTTAKEDGWTPEKEVDFAIMLEELIPIYD